MFKKILFSTIAAAGLAVACVPAHARGSLDVSIGLGGYPVGGVVTYSEPAYVAPAPVYYPPAPVYYPPPRTYYRPAPVYVAPAPVYFDYRGHWGGYEHRGWDRGDHRGWDRGGDRGDHRGRDHDRR